jgi:AsmA family protein
MRKRSSRLPSVADKFTPGGSRTGIWPLRGPRRTVLVLAGLMVAVVTAVTIGEQHLQAALLRALAAHTGRQIRVYGSFDVHLFSRQPRITAQQVVVENPPWVPPGVTAQVGRISVLLQWRFAPLPFGIRRVELENAQLHLMRDANGRANWLRYADGPGDGPPLIHGLRMADAHVELQDALWHLQFAGLVTARDAGGDAAAGPLDIEARGELNGRAAALHLTGDPLAKVRRDRPYHYSVSAVSGATQLSAQGLVERPFDLRAQHGSFEASGPDLRDLDYLIGVQLPDTGPFKLSGRVTLQNRRLQLSDLGARFGGSDMHGKLAVARSRGREEIDGDLYSGRLRLADLGARAAGRAPEQAPTAPALRLPDAPLPLAALLSTDVRVKFGADELDVGTRALQGLAATVVINHGVLRIDDVRASLAQGTLSGSARFDAAAESPTGELTLSATDLQLASLKSQDARAPPIAGLLSARVQLKGNGKSPRQLAATASGTMAASLVRGELRATLAEGASLDLTGLLAAQFGRNKNTAIRCGLASLDVSAGTVTARTLVLDTDDVVIRGSGTVHMDTETLDLQLHGQPKHPGLTLRSAVNIRGDLAHPQIHLDNGRLAAQGAAAMGLGVVLTPVAALLAFVNPGLAHDADCGSLLAEAGRDLESG